jgi:uncharacterized membrane protein YidH (DUF202 family)
MQQDYNDAAQLERSVLSWNRSSLALAANGALIARAGIERHLIPVVVVGAVVVAVGAAVWVFSTGRYSSASSRLAGHVIADRRAVVGGTAIFVGALSLIDLALVITA